MDKKKILLASENLTLSENLLAIQSELKGLDYHVKVLVCQDKYTIDKIIFRAQFSYYMATAKIILLDDFFPLVYPFKVRPTAKLIQVWHALGAFKQVGFSRAGKPGGPAYGSLTHKNYTDAIVSSPNVITHYAEAFGISESKVHATGIPRTDLFFDELAMEQAKEEVYKTYPKLRDKQVFLFAPTFRGHGKKDAFYPEAFLNLEKLYQQLDSESIWIIKMHPFIQKKIKIPKRFQNKIIDCSHERRMNSLLFITDVLITDYSSTLFEFSFLNRPVIFYAPDLEEYLSTRGFYYDYQTYAYGEVCDDFDSLLKKMKNPKINSQKLKEFKQNFTSSCDGKSTKRFVEKFIKLSERVEGSIEETHH